jgi:hypothetical protein
VKLAIVYQAGIANVFQVDKFDLGDASERKAKRIMQTSFDAAIMFMRGAQYAGAEVKTAYCNQAGDISAREWSNNADDAPFSTMAEVYGGLDWT